MARPIPLEKQDHIQFLNNVHFPERHLQRSQTQPVISNPPAEWQALLPPNTSLAEVLESRVLQVDWYRHLVNTAGIEVANRFKELVVRMTEKLSGPPVGVSRTLDELFGEKSLPHFQMVNGFPPPKPQVSEFWSGHAVPPGEKFFLRMQIFIHNFKLFN